MPNELTARSLDLVSRPQLSITWTAMGYLLKRIASIPGLIISGLNSGKGVDNL